MVGTISEKANFLPTNQPRFVTVIENVCVIQSGDVHANRRFEKTKKLSVTRKQRKKNFEYLFFSLATCTTP